MRVTLDVKGMTCGHCVRAVTTALEDTDGVTGVSVELEFGRADLDAADEGAVQRAIAAIEEEGYEARRAG